MPCGKSIRSLATCHPFASTNREITIPAVEAQGVVPLVLNHLIRRLSRFGDLATSGGTGVFVSTDSKGLPDRVIRERAMRS